MVRTTGTPRHGGWSRAAALVAVAVWLLVSPAGAVSDFTKYHTHAELTAALKSAVAAHANLARMVSIGKSREGRDLWTVEIANPAGAPANERPALLITANLEGDHLVGSELALFIVESLLAGYGADATITQRLDQHVVYVVPRLNPDGAEQMFAAVKTGTRTNLTPYDDDNDARIDEDGPEDLNKDGVITVMRVKDPAGRYMISPDDPRLMKKADPAKGEAGGWAIYLEGIDNDGDGFINEDGPGGVDLNRNFMHQYPYYATDSGRHMASEAETRALLDFVLTHRNIAAILTFGEHDSLIAGEPGKASAPGVINLLDFAEQSTVGARKTGMFAETGGGLGGRGGPGQPGPAATPAAGARAPSRSAATTVNPGDTEYLRVISDKYRELTGLRSTGVTRTPAGAFSEYGYYQYGVPSFSTPGFGLPGTSPTPAGAPALAQRGRMPGAAPDAASLSGASAEGIDLRLLQWMDAEKIDGFVPWTPFAHPTLGAVEIGGFKPYVTTNPPVGKIAGLGAAHTKFVVYLTSLFPKVAIARAEATTLAAGVYRVKAEIENTGFLPTALTQGVLARAVTPVMVQLRVPPETIVTGAEKTTYVPVLAGSGSRQSFEWVITAKPGTAVTLKVLTQKAGTATATVTLQ
jgi:hypothetical protein